MRAFSPRASVEGAQRLDQIAVIQASQKTRLVVRWVEAHNSRDLDAMLACATDDFEFHPLRLTRREGSASAYLGHDGLRRWFADLTESGSEHELAPVEIEENGTDQVLVVGSVEAPGHSAIAPFCALYDIDISNGLIRRARHYISDRQTMEELGLVQPSE